MIQENIINMIIVRIIFNKYPKKKCKKDQSRRNKYIITYLYFQKIKYLGYV